LVATQEFCAEEGERDGCQGAFAWHFGVLAGVLLLLCALEPPQAIDQCKGRTVGTDHCDQDHCDYRGGHASCPGALHRQVQVMDGKLTSLLVQANAAPHAAEAVHSYTTNV
jgi:hypothetical protein